MQIADRVFVVTGGGNGIGREVVLELLRRGARVAAADLSEEGLATIEAIARAFGILEGPEVQEPVRTTLL